jgi:hypothetical protein
VRPEEAAKLFLRRLVPPGGLLLEGAERSELALGGEDILHRGGPEGPDQLVLEVGDADEEAESLEVGAGEVRAELCALQSPLEMALLRGVTEAGQPEALRPEPGEEASDCVRAAHRDDGNPLGFEPPAAAQRQRLDGQLVAHPLDEDDQTDDSPAFPQSFHGRIVAASHRGRRTHRKELACTHASRGSTGST